MEFSKRGIKVVRINQNNALLQDDERETVDYMPLLGRTRPCPDFRNQQALLAIWLETWPSHLTETISGSGHNRKRKYRDIIVMSKFAIAITYIWHF